MAQIVLTGSTGFIGHHLAPVLQSYGHRVVEAGRVRRQAAQIYARIPDIGPNTDWTGALDGADAVIHLAGLAHAKAADENFWAVNDAGTQKLVESCTQAGVRSFILLSSIAAREADTPYGRSKLAGEHHVMAAVERQEMTGVILRPPLVYGSDAPGNWQKIQKIAAKNLLLPFGSVQNRRSFCSVENLCDAIAAALKMLLEGKGSGVYEIADRETVSLREIITYLRQGMGRKPGLMPVPISILRLAFMLTGQAKLTEALLDDLTLDPTDFMRAFGWTPSQNTKEAIGESGRLFEKARSAENISA